MIHIYHICCACWKTRALVLTRWLVSQCGRALDQFVVDASEGRPLPAQGTTMPPAPPAVAELTSALCDALAAGSAVTVVAEGKPGTPQMLAAVNTLVRVSLPTCAVNAVVLSPPHSSHALSFHLLPQSVCIPV